MTGLAAVIAATGSSVAAQAQSRAVGLDVTKTLAVVALLGLSGARKRAAVGLVAGLLAVVAKALRGGADLGVVADVATLVAGTTRERRHDDVLEMGLARGKERRVRCCAVVVEVACWKSALLRPLALSVTCSVATGSSDG